MTTNKPKVPRWAIQIAPTLNRENAKALLDELIMTDGYICFYKLARNPAPLILFDNEEHRNEAFEKLINGAIDVNVRLLEMPVLIPDDSRRAN